MDKELKQSILALPKGELFRIKRYLDDMFDKTLTKSEQKYLERWRQLPPEAIYDTDQVIDLIAKELEKENKFVKLIKFL